MSDPDTTQRDGDQNNAQQSQGFVNKPEGEVNQTFINYHYVPGRPPAAARPARRA
ncbi:MAG: hypothetical protein HC914_09100, partial [Chloroflexaceae bacterium]|nr:hypothetical protein [Chloroflexaceae bacterium]